jgi:DNA-binding MarR family transcriptional regulator
MHERSLTPEVRNFVLQHIDSVAQLEALLFLRTRPAERLDASDIAKTLYASPGEMNAALEGLHGRGLLVREDDRYGYNHRSPDRAQVEALANAYAHHLIPITNLIHSKPRNIRAFSDAFKFRKD